MRIISGDLKGRNILRTLNKSTRPLKDKVRESIFNLLDHSKKICFKIEKSKILDLYSGTGSFGIECLSRNVNNVVFVEKDPLAFSVLKKNISNLKLINKSKLIYQDVKHFVEKSDGKNKFDLFFLDPPYKDTSFVEIIGLIKEKKLFTKHHSIIIHREKKCEEELSKFLKVDFQKNYGRSKIVIGSF